MRRFNALLPSVVLLRQSVTATSLLYADDVRKASMKKEALKTRVVATAPNMATKDAFETLQAAARFYATY